MIVMMTMMVSFPIIMLYSILQATKVILACEQSAGLSYHTLLPRVTPPDSPTISSIPARRGSSSLSQSAISRDSTSSKSASLSPQPISPAVVQQTPPQKTTKGVKRGRILKKLDSSSDSQDPGRYIKSSMRADSMEKKAKKSRTHTKELIDEYWTHSDTDSSGSGGPMDTRRHNPTRYRVRADMANDIAANSRTLSKVYKAAGRYSRGAGEIDRAQLNENKAEIARKTGSLWSSKYREAKLAASGLKMLNQAEILRQQGLANPHNQALAAEFTQQARWAIENQNKIFRQRNKAHEKRLELQDLENSFVQSSGEDQRLLGYFLTSPAPIWQNGRPGTPESTSSIETPQSLSSTSASSARERR